MSSFQILAIGNKSQSYKRLLPQLTPIHKRFLPEETYRKFLTPMIAAIVNSPFQPTLKDDVASMQVEHVVVAGGTINEVILTINRIIGLPTKKGARLHYGDMDRNHQVTIGATEEELDVSKTVCWAGDAPLNKRLVSYSIKSQLYSSVKMGNVIRLIHSNKSEDDLERRIGKTSYTFLPFGNHQNFPHEHSFEGSAVQRQVVIVGRMLHCSMCLSTVMHATRTSLETFVKWFYTQCAEQFPKKEINAHMIPEHQENYVWGMLAQEEEQGGQLKEVVERLIGDKQKLEKNLKEKEEEMEMLEVEKKKLKEKLKEKEAKVEILEVDKKKLKEKLKEEEAKVEMLEQKVEKAGKKMKELEKEVERKREIVQNPKIAAASHEEEQQSPINNGETIHLENEQEFHMETPPPYYWTPSVPDAAFLATLVKKDVQFGNDVIKSTVFQMSAEELAKFDEEGEIPPSLTFGTKKPSKATIKATGDAVPMTNMFPESTCDHEFRKRFVKAYLLDKEKHQFTQMVYIEECGETALAYVQFDAISAATDFSLCRVPLGLVSCQRCFAEAKKEDEKEEEEGGERAKRGQTK